MLHRPRAPRLGFVLVVLASCASHADDAPTDPPGSVFVAFAKDFADFRTWTSFHSDGPTGNFPPDVLGPRTQYVNKVPAKGSTEFPVGTIIVEARESGAKNIFAGVKRGANFNSAGCKNWEWFQLIESTAGTIKWRGVGPPLGEVYGGDPNGGC